MGDTPATDAVDEIALRTPHEVRKGQSEYHVIVEVPSRDAYVGEVGKIMYDHGFHLSSTEELEGREKTKLQFHTRYR